MSARRVLRWLLGALAVFVAYHLGTRSGFAEGYLRGLKKQVGVDDLLELFDAADREAWGSDGPERPEVS